MPEPALEFSDRSPAGRLEAASGPPARQGWRSVLHGCASGLAAATLLAASGRQFCQAAQAVEVSVVTVQILGLRNDRGVVKAALYDSAEAWSRDRGAGAAGAVQLQEAPISAGKATLRFTGVPYGRYALRAFHDEDRSGRFYTGLFGIPRVEVIFSNDVPIWQGLAPFARASFQVNAPHTSLVLRAQRI